MPWLAGNLTQSIAFPVIFHHLIAELVCKGVPKKTCLSWTDMSVIDHGLLRFSVSHIPWSLGWLLFVSSTVMSEYLWTIWFHLGGYGTLLIWLLLDSAGLGTVDKLGVPGKNSYQLETGDGKELAGTFFPSSCGLFWGPDFLFSLFRDISQLLCLFVANFEVEVQQAQEWITSLPFLCLPFPSSLSISPSLTYV